jgi:hypothetical protein
MQRMLRTYKQKIKNKRVLLAYDDKRKTFIIQFKRLIFDGEIIKKTSKNTTAKTQIHRNKLIVTTIEISEYAGVLLILNFKNFFNDLENGMYSDFDNAKQKTL